MALSKEEQAELDAINADLLSPQERAELDALNAELEPPATKMIRTGKQAIQGAGKLLDVLRGGVTAPIAAALLELRTGKDVYRPAEHLDAVNPTNLRTFPGLDELTARAGKPLTAAIPPRAMPLAARLVPSLPGIVADAAIDPASWLAMPLKAAGEGVEALGKTSLATKLLEALKAPVEKLPVLATGPSRTMRGAGEALYGWGIRPLEQAGERKGKEIAETLYRHGVHGSARQMMDQMAEKASTLKNELDAIYAEADAAGALTDRGRAFGPFMEELDQLVLDGRLSKAQAEKILEETIGTYLTRGDQAGTKLMSQWKGDIDNKLDAAVFEATKSPDLVNRVKKVARTGTKEEVENVVDAVTGRGAEVRAKNADLGDFLSVAPQALQYAQAQERLRLLGHLELGAGLGVGAITQNPFKGLLFLGAKKGLDLGRLPWFRTNLGYGMQRVADNPISQVLLDVGMRRGAVELGKEKKDGQE